MRCALSILAWCWLVSLASAADLTTWQTQPPEWKGAVVNGSTAKLTSENWSFLVAPQASSDVEAMATVTIDEPAKLFRFFGSSWSVWPDHTYGDQGFEASLLLRGTEATPPQRPAGYRVQLSHKLQELTLVRYPDGGYLASVPCEVPLKTPLVVKVRAAGRVIRASLNGRELIHYVDRLEPALSSGQVGIGVSSAAKLTVSDVAVVPVPTEVTPPEEEHRPNFKARPWIGGRSWVFDGHEPILLLPSPESSYINNVKLKPGYKPQLSWNSHWDIQNQGAFPEGTNTTVNVQTTGDGPTLVATWQGKHPKDRFGTRTTMTIGFNVGRGVYTYDVDSELDVRHEPFQFRYGYDFEHHTPLDPFNWQYLIAKRRSGELYHRPVYPIDPGPQNDLETYQGLRVWYGRHNEPLQVAPSVEYSIPNEAKRQLNTAVCAAFYDTAVAFAPETAAPGTKVHVKYRYSGFKADEARGLFEQSKVYDSPTLDPTHHYIFADQWPKLTFNDYVPLSQTWIYGRTPFMTAHNTRPTYELVKNCGAGSGFAMKLGPASFGKAKLSKAAPLIAGRYVVTALIKSINTHGPGGRIELEATQVKTNKVLASATHFVGNGSFDWQPQGFMFTVPEEVGGLSLAFGNSGTGEMLVTDVEFRRLNDGDTAPPGVLTSAREQSPQFASAPQGAIVDHRMEEGRGHHVFNYAGGRHLELANLDWVVDAGRPALRFAELAVGRKDFDRNSGLAQQYFANAAYVGKETLPIALSGTHGGGSRLNGLTIAAWIKPAPEMGQSSHRGKGDIVGYGARRFILGLLGQTPPYKLTARINVNDTFTSTATLDADRWYHVAMTAEPTAGQWRVRLFLDGQPAAEGMTQKFSSDSIVPPSLVLGAELLYFHDAYYRGLIGRTLVFDRALAPPEIAELAR